MSTTPDLKPDADAIQTRDGFLKVSQGWVNIASIASVTRSPLSFHAVSVIVTRSGERFDLEGAFPDAVLDAIEAAK